MKNSRIEWTDHTFNPWEGCTKVSCGCAHCYAEARNARFGGGTAPNWGKGAPRRRTSVNNWSQPVHWNRAAAKFMECTVCGTRAVADDKAIDVLAGLLACPECNADEGHLIPARPRVFCASLADWLDGDVPVEWRENLLNLIRTTPYLDWLLLTKRPEQWRERIEEVIEFSAIPDEDDTTTTTSDWCIDWLNGDAPANVWIGTTVEDQQRADERIPALLSIPARVRFLSCEPLLGPVDLTQWLHPEGRCGECLELIRVNRDSVSCGCCCEGSEPTLERTDLINWIICGGESGKDARPMNPDWARNLRAQCAAAGVPFLFKQWGEWVRNADIIAANPGAESRIVLYGDGDDTNFRRVYRVGKKAAGRLLDGVEHNAFPEAR